MKLMKELRKFTHGEMLLSGQRLYMAMLWRKFQATLETDLPGLYRKRDRFSDYVKFTTSRIPMT
jgi:hypothetical protein